MKNKFKLFKRKKGSLIIEFLVAIPAIYFAAWACMFIIMYSMSQNVVHQAAFETAQALTQELRGSEDNIPNTTTVQSLILDKAKTSASYYNYLLLFHDSNHININPTVIIEPSGTCYSAVQAYDRAICAQTIRGTVSGVEQQQILVVIRSKFYVIANVIPNKDMIFAQGQGSSEKEISGRFNYW